MSEAFPLSRHCRVWKYFVILKRKKEKNKHTLTHIHHLCYLFMKHIGFNVYYCDQSKDFCAVFTFCLFLFLLRSWKKNSENGSDTSGLLEKQLHSKPRWLSAACLSLSARLSHALTHTLSLYFSVLLFLLLPSVCSSACVCMCVSPVGLPMVSVSLSLVTALIKELQLFFVSHLLLSVLLASAHTDCLLQLCVNSVPGGGDVPVKLMSTRSRSSPLVTGVLSPVQPVHSEESSLSPYDEIRSTLTLFCLQVTLKLSLSLSAGKGTEVEIKPCQHCLINSFFFLTVHVL